MQIYVLDSFTGLLRFRRFSYVSTGNFHNKKITKLDVADGSANKRIDSAVRRYYEVRVDVLLCK